LDPPFQPPPADNYDDRIGHNIFKDSYSQKSLSNAMEILNNKVRSMEEIQSLFKDYYFDYRDKTGDKVSSIATIKELKETK
jgi:ribosome-binding protein aMBF1 (putative translation factor)